MVGFDVLVFLALLRCKVAFTSGKLIPGRIVSVVALGLAALGFSAFLAIYHHRPGEMEHALRRDEHLMARIDLDADPATQDRILDSLSVATGFTFSVDDGLGKRQPEFGAIRFSQLQAWAVMEYVANEQTTPSMWEKSADSYRLVPVAAWRQIPSKFLVFLAGIGAVLVVYALLVTKELVGSGGSGATAHMVNAS